MKKLNRSKILMAVVLGALAFMATLMVQSLQTDPGQAQEPQPASIADAGSAHVVVQFANGDSAVRPISWTGTISRVMALQLAGFDVANNGDSVCSINGEGCPDTNCFCPSNLWAQGQWAYSGWDDVTWPPPNVVDGDVLAFRDATQPDYSDWGVAGRLPSAPVYVSASDALEWMRGQQQADGSYQDAFGQVGASARALVALGSAGYDPGEWGTPSLLNYLTVVSRTETVEYAASSAAAAGKLALGAAWSGQVVTDFAGINLPISITAYYSPTTGAYGDGSGDTAWAVLGLHAAGEEIPPKTIEFFGRVQNDDGGWAWNEWGATSETQQTALCVQALLAAGEPPTSTAVLDALAFVDGAQNKDAGYAYTPGGDSDVSATAYAIQGWLSAGGRPTGNWCTAMRLQYLLDVQAADGSFPGFSPAYATQEAIPALMHRSYGPLAAWSYGCYMAYLPSVSKSP